MPVNTYDEALAYLYGRINYERIHSQSYSSDDFKLERMRQLLSLAGNPHNGLPVVHIAGTKGKGSTSTMVASMLSAAGYRTGLYTSPHIHRFEERFTVDGKQPTETEVIELTRRVVPIAAEMDARGPGQGPTYFEIATLFAWWHFRDQHAQVAVLEVGLGGRLDSTNICEPAVCVITSISRDHMHLLGGTIGLIAAEKAGIIKPNIPVISGASHPEAHAVIRQVAQSKNALLIEFPADLKLNILGSDEQGRRTIDAFTPGHTFQGIQVPLCGEHQAANCCLALAVISLLEERGFELATSAINTGLGRVTWPGRIETLGTSPRVIVDAAHNWESTKALVRLLQEQRHYRKRILIFASTQDKDVAGLLRQLVFGFDTVIFTRYQENPRGVPIETLAAMLSQITSLEPHRAATPAAAWNLAKELSNPADLIVVTGSFFLVTELRQLILSEQAEHSDN